MIEQNLSTRTQTAILLLVGTLLFISLGGYFAGTLALVCAGAAQYEFCSLVRSLRQQQRLQATFCGLLAPLGYMIFDFPGAVAGLIVGAMLLSILILSWVEAANDALLIEEVTAPLFASFIYPGIFSLSLVSSALHVPGAHLVWFVLIVCANDSCAYFIGKQFGNEKLSSRVSPGKTQIGFWGGAVGAVVCSIVVGAVLAPEKSFVGLAVSGGAIALFAVLGDLVESLWKRYFHVKDSSSVLPGHGGVLDRIDAILFASPLLFVLV